MKNSPASLPATTDVLVVGYGPVGAALTALLGRYGADVLVADREGVPAIEYARDNGYDEIVEILEKAALDQTARQALAAEEQKKREAAEKDPLIQRIKSIRIEDDNSEAIKRLSKKISDAKLSG